MIFRFDIWFLTLTCQTSPAKVSTISEIESITETTNAYQYKSQEMRRDPIDTIDDDNEIGPLYDDFTSKTARNARQSKRKKYLESQQKAKNKTEENDACACIQQMPIYVHLDEDELNQKQNERNSKLQFALSQSVYLDLNGVCNLESLQKLIVFLIFTLL